MDSGKWYRSLLALICVVLALALIIDHVRPRSTLHGEGGFAAIDASATGVRSQLNQAAFAVAWTEGGAMAFEQAFACALGGSDNDTSGGKGG